MRLCCKIFPSHHIYINYVLISDSLCTKLSFSQLLNSARPVTILLSLVCSGITKQLRLFFDCSHQIFSFYTVSQKKTVQISFLSEFRQISTNFGKFWQKDSKEAKIMRGALILHLT